jgi:anti-sigma-K factor RskA
MNERVAGYLLGELPPDERAAFEAELESDAALRTEVERLAPVVSRLEAMEPAAWEPLPAPPPLALPPAAEPAEPALEPEPEREPKPERERERGAAWWRRSLTLRPLPAAALAVVLLALGIAAGILAGGGADEGAVSAGRVVTLAPVEPGGDDGAEGTATLAGSGDRATVKLRGLPPSEPGQFYELWLLNTVDDMVALGSFSVPASGALDVTVPLPADAGRFGALDLSLEPDDGDPAHSTTSVLRAPLKSS